MSYQTFPPPVYQFLFCAMGHRGPLKVLIDPKWVWVTLRMSLCSLFYQKNWQILLLHSSTKGQSISKGLFFSILPKKQTKNFCPSRLWQKLKFQVRFEDELKTPKFPFEINWPLSCRISCQFFLLELVKTLVMSSNFRHKILLLD